MSWIHNKINLFSPPEIPRCVPLLTVDSSWDTKTNFTISPYVLCAEESNRRNRAAMSNFSVNVDRLTKRLPAKHTRWNKSNVSQRNLSKINYSQETTSFVVFTLPMWAVISCNIIDCLHSLPVRNTSNASGSVDQSMYNMLKDFF